MAAVIAKESTAINSINNIRQYKKIFIATVVSAILFDICKRILFGHGVALIIPNIILSTIIVKNILDLGNLCASFMNTLHKK